MEDLKASIVVSIPHTESAGILTGCSIEVSSIELMAFNTKGWSKLHFKDSFHG
jgi:hypothetical protein